MATATKPYNKKQILNYLEAQKNKSSYGYVRSGYDYRALHTMKNWLEENGQSLIDFFSALGTMPSDHSARSALSFNQFVSCFGSHYAWRKGDQAARWHVQANADFVLVNGKDITERKLSNLLSNLKRLGLAEYNSLADNCLYITGDHDKFTEVLLSPELAKFYGIAQGKMLGTMDFNALRKKVSGHAKKNGIDAAGKVEFRAMVDGKFQTLPLHQIATATKVVLDARNFSRELLGDLCNINKDILNWGILLSSYSNTQTTTIQKSIAKLGGTLISPEHLIQSVAKDFVNNLTEHEALKILQSDYHVYSRKISESVTTHKTENKALQVASLSGVDGRFTNGRELTKPIFEAMRGKWPVVDLVLDETLNAQTLATAANKI